MGVEFDKTNIFEYDVKPWITFKYVKKDIADEMLDALIKAYTALEYVSDYDIPLTTHESIKDAIEKATGKPIDQILKESQNAKNV